MTDTQAVCSCGACRTLMGHTGTYWTCRYMPDTDPHYCPECGDHLLPCGQREAWSFGGEIIGGLRAALEWLLDEGFYMRPRFDGKPGFIPIIMEQPAVGPDADLTLKRLAAVVGVPVGHLTGTPEPPR